MSMRMKSSYGAIRIIPSRSFWKIVKNFFISFVYVMLSSFSSGKMVKFIDSFKKLDFDAIVSLRTRRSSFLKEFRYGVGFPVSRISVSSEGKALMSKSVRFISFQYSMER